MCSLKLKWTDFIFYISSVFVLLTVEEICPL
jgi:hypothetical protein